MPIKAVRGVRDILPAEAPRWPGGRSTSSAANRPFSLALGFSVPEFRFPYLLDHSLPGSTIRARRLIEAPWPRFRVISRPGPAPSATPARWPLGPGTRPALTEVDLERIVTSKRERLHLRPFTAARHPGDDRPEEQGQVEGRARHVVGDGADAIQKVPHVGHPRVTHWTTPARDRRHPSSPSSRSRRG